MEGNYNDHTSATDLGRRNYLFADQSDTKTVYVYPTQSSRSTIKDKLEDGFEKSKAVASTGLKKIKRGSTVGDKELQQQVSNLPLKCIKTLKPFLIFCA
ncbi:hypothetical protein L2E82_15820 [Cichorium intybus]|uniref:Uncharacterized protein n=1 Tax=Cichorium intybus TaxID=13427 RepID=A0ACB9F514_CICIN|nr:hypothetical protein L2E82_15820 [Cichorium intybus]